ncbi:hypothetical protein GCM10022271_02790 [Corallibacter vietnamensis]|uniref:Peptidase M56 domain-containing protein n=2 Tax=Corallibacter vietnamensis TaxID=904130 RepID=A0ABP7GRP7_9FLAO
MISAIIPLITFITYVEIASIEIPAYNSEIATPPYVPEHMLEGLAEFWSIILWSIYLIGVLVFTIRFGMNLSNILKRIKHNPKFKNHSVIHVLLNDLVHPHTFLNYIFLNKSKYEAHEIPKEVLLHEEIHAKQKHALDILFIEILQILFWFNPLIYFIKKDIKLNHEFLADQAVLNHGFELKNYQNTLLAFSSNATEPQLANAINYSSIKKRFTVMKTHTSKHIIWVRSLVLLPLLATLIYSFSGREEVIKETPQILLPQEKNKNEINVVDSVKKELENVNSLEVDYKNKQQKGASKEQIAEYNKLAKHINLQNKDNPIIKIKDLERLKYLYNLMTEEQRKSAEPFPNIPSPPAPPAPEAVSEKDKAGKAHTYKYTNKNGRKIKVKAEKKDTKTPPPPPPPVPENATKEQKEKYQKISEEYYKKYKVENGKVSEREPLPPAPPAPKTSAPKPPKAPEVIEVVEKQNIPSPSSTKSAFEFVQSLKNDDITYYYNKKKVSYDEILKIVKKEPNINISTNIKNNKGTVKFWSVK